MINNNKSICHSFQIIFTRIFYFIEIIALLNLESTMKIYTFLSFRQVKTFMKE
jgi:hypothetical protein